MISPPYGAVLTLGADEECAVVRNGMIRKATMMTATLSVAHRAIDGALGARFLRAFRIHLESSARMAA